MHEVAIRGAVRRLHVHVRFGHSGRVRDLWQHHGHACSQHHAELLSCYYQTESLVLLPVVLKMILIAHIPSLSTPDCTQTARALNSLHPLGLLWVHWTPSSITVRPG